MSDSRLNFNKKASETSFTIFVSASTPIDGAQPNTHAKFWVGTTFASSVFPLVFFCSTASVKSEFGFLAKLKHKITNQIQREIKWPDRFPNRYKLAQIRAKTPLKRHKSVTYRVHHRHLWTVQSLSVLVLIFATPTEVCSLQWHFVWFWSLMNSLPIFPPKPHDLLLLFFRILHELFVRVQLSNLRLWSRRRSAYSMQICRFDTNWGRVLLLREFVLRFPRTYRNQPKD